jgi:hypothetical protein
MRIANANDPALYWQRFTFVIPSDKPTALLSVVRDQTTVERSRVAVLSRAHHFAVILSTAKDLLFCPSPITPVF